MKLSDHFSLAEMIVSQEAARAGIDNMPGHAEIKNMRRLCAVMEQVRDLFGAPIIVTSGYRSPATNRIVGGSLNSAHMAGLAMDFIVPEVGPPIKIARAIADDKTIEFDQLIHEHGAWVHLGLRAGKSRRMLLSTRGKIYLNGIVDI